MVSLISVSVTQFGFGQRAELKPFLTHINYVPFLPVCTALKAGRSRVRFPRVSLELFIEIIIPAAL